MGWLKQLERTYSHDCVLPSPYAAAAGSVWQCDDCMKKWRIVVHVGVPAILARRHDDFEWELIPAEVPDFPPGDHDEPGFQFPEVS